MAIVFVPHTTAAVTINENADPSVQHDILADLNRLVPFAGPYQHTEGNSAAHIKSSLVGPSETLIIEEGRLKLGTWQGVYFCEFDGPRTRKVWVKIIPG
jgi:secondary thiamine-phosphate synthase enzyme